MGRCVALTWRDDVQRTNLVAQDVGKHSAKYGSRIQDRHQIEREAIAGVSTMLAVEADVEEADVESDKAYQAAKHKSHKGDIFERRPVDK